ncbi:MAG TPA: ABC transporter ATPase [Bacteroidetes bacterium]|nr:ABC transporter ATPase [Bacteroidota bacterium]
MQVSYDEIPSSAKVWIYQSDRIIKADEKENIKKALSGFLNNWDSHQSPLKCYGDIWYDIFIIIMVDENLNNASGCSIDKSVHFIKEVEKEMGLSLMDRMIFAYKEKEDIKLVSRSDFQNGINKGDINENTRVFNNLVITKAEFELKWEVPLKESWHKQLC